MPGHFVRAQVACSGGTAARDSFIAAKERSSAYWLVKCARDLDRLMRHFARDAEVITPNGVCRGREAIAALYRKSLDDFPGLTVDVKAGFVGRDAHCFEYSVVLSGGADNRWLIEGTNLIRLRRGLISGLRSFEDAPRRRLSD